MLVMLTTGIPFLNFILVVRAVSELEQLLFLHQVRS